VLISLRKILIKLLKEIVMAASSSKPTVEDSIQVALDAADTAAGVTEEFNTIKEQFEVQNIQAKRIYQSITIIFASSIAAALISLTVGFFMYYKALSTLQTNSNMAIESIAIFSENVGELAKAVKTVESNTENQETIKATLSALEDAALKASEDVSGADARYNNAIKIGITETERVIQDFASTTLEELKDQSFDTQMKLSEQIAEIKSIFEPSTPEEGEDPMEQEVDNLVKSSQIEALEVKIDELMLLQKDIAAKLLEEQRKSEVQAKAKKRAPKPAPKPASNPLKFP
jgi:type III secretory pathway component EscR